MNKPTPKAAAVPAPRPGFMAEFAAAVLAVAYATAANDPAPHTKAPAQVIKATAYNACNLAEAALWARQQLLEAMPTLTPAQARRLDRFALQAVEPALALLKADPYLQALTSDPNPEAIPRAFGRYAYQLAYMLHRVLEASPATVEGSA
jgi:hypothetical protein